MYKIDFEIKLKFDPLDPTHHKEEIDVFFNSNLYLIKKGVEFGFKRCLEIRKTGICKINSEKFGFLRGRFFYSNLGLRDIEKAIDICIRREFRDGWGSDIIIETRFDNIVEFNNIYYYLFVLLKEKIQSAFSSLTQKFLC